MTTMSYINRYFRKINEGFYLCELCGSSLPPNDGIYLWTHYMKSHNEIGIVTLFDRAYLWVEESDTFNIGLEVQHMFEQYPQAAYLIWEMSPSNVIKLLFKVAPCGIVGKTTKKDGYYTVCEEDYNLIYDIMRVQSYECMFPECGHIYDCLPSKEMMNAHHRLHFL